VKSKILKFGTGAMLVSTIALSAVWLIANTSTKVAAHESEDHAQVAQAQGNNQPTASKPVIYAYVAQPGNSYTLMARKAVQTYGKKFKVNLSPAKIIYAETNLTQQAGSPLLDLSQGVGISEAAIKQWVDRARTLSAAQEAAWNYYVQFVDFNTDAVGVAR